MVKARRCFKTCVRKCKFHYDVKQTNKLISARQKNVKEYWELLKRASYWNVPNIRRKEMFYLTTHSTHFIYGYMASKHMVKDHSDSERGNPLPPHGLLFPINARVILYAPSHRQGSTYHGLCYTSRGVLAGTRNRSMGPP